MKKTIEIVQLIGSEYSITEEDGALVANEVVAVLQRGDDVALSFQEVEMMTTPFIRALVAPLLEGFLDKEPYARFTMTKIGAGDLARIKFVINDMELRLRDPENYDRARQFALESA